MDIVAWVLQVLLCLMFLIHAVQMLRPNREQLTSRGMSYIVDMPSGLRIFAGVAEALAALGLVLPWATGILPWLTPLAAAGLVLIMVGAIVLHIPRREIPNIGLNLALLVMAAVVAYVRWPALAM
jgi:uncharacterized membrane protein YphA (DoxX/SURF4 family)